MASGLRSRAAHDLGGHVSFERRRRAEPETNSPLSGSASAEPGDRAATAGASGRSASARAESAAAGWPCAARGGDDHRAELAGPRPAGGTSSGELRPAPSVEPLPDRPRERRAPGRCEARRHRAGPSTDPKREITARGRGRGSVERGTRGSEGGLLLVTASEERASSRTRTRCGGRVVVVGVAASRPGGRPARASTRRQLLAATSLRSTGGSNRARGSPRATAPAPPAAISTGSGSAFPPLATPRTASRIPVVAARRPARRTGTTTAGGAVDPDGHRAHGPVRGCGRS